MRLFLAIDLDPAAQTAIAAEQKRLAAMMREHASSIKWVRPDHIHLTLIFLGELDEARAALLVGELGRAVPQPPFDIVLGGFGVFPPRGAPNVLWVGLTSGAEPAIALQRTMSERVRGQGITVETRPFSPHLTLARWRSSRPADRRRVAAADTRDLARVHVDHVTLYQSRLSSAGPSYTVLARANLCST